MMYGQHERPLESFPEFPTDLSSCQKPAVWLESFMWSGKLDSEPDLRAGIKSLQLVMSYVDFQLKLQGCHNEDEIMVTVSTHLQLSLQSPQKRKLSWVGDKILVKHPVLIHYEIILTNLSGPQANK